MNLDMLVQNAGWTLLHSLWQIAVTAALLKTALCLISEADAKSRYIVSTAALVIALVIPVYTFLEISVKPNGTGLMFRNAPSADENSLPLKGRKDVDRVKIVSSDTEKSDFEDSVGLKNVSQLRTFIAENIPSVFPIAVSLWFFGVAIFSLRLIGGFWQLHRYRNRHVEPLDRNWLKRFCELSVRLSITTKVSIASSNLLPAPIAIGIFRPMILIPAGLFLQMDPRQLESIIAHELIHIRRYDPVINVFQNIAESLFFFHPCLWWISRQIRREREFAADALVASAYSNDRTIYASALASLEGIRLATNQTTPSLATAANGGNLMLRIKRILNEQTEISDANAAWSAGVAFILISAVLLALFSFTPTSSVNAQRPSNDRKLAIGFVSIPPLDRGNDPPKDADATARLIIAKLQQFKVPAIGFVNAAQISDGQKLFPVRANIVRLWRDAGLDVGIGTFKHIWFYNTPYDDYVASVEKNEIVTRKLLGEKKVSLRYFSYPYLNTGKNADERDRFEQWLANQGLQSVKYTIDNQEWMYSYAYDMARNENDISKMNETRADFVRYMEKMLDHYEAYSQELFGRDIAETMVLTPSRLVADSADELFGMIKNRGYHFVSMDEALSDEAYKTPENMFGEFGNSWLERWTYSQGKKLREEPLVDAEIYAVWKDRGVKNK